LRRAAGDLLGAVFLLAVVVNLIEFHDGSLCQDLPICNGGEVAEDIITSTLRLDKPKATVVPAARRAGASSSRVFGENLGGWCRALGGKSFSAFLVGHDC